MGSVQDNRGYNQGFKPSKALTVRFERRCARMIKEMSIHAETKILELGCGLGELSFLIAKKTGASVTGTDLCQTFIEQAKAHYRIPNLNFQEFKLGDFESQSNLQETYDYIVGNGILHHVVNNLERVLVQLKNRLKPGGKLLFWEPNIFNPYIFFIFKFPILRKVAKLEPDEMAFGRSFITEKLKSSGFSKPEVEYSDFLLPNTPAALIKPVIQIGDFLEKIPALDHLAQSLFISAQSDAIQSKENY